MCYMLILSTSSKAELSKHNSALLKFEKELPPLAECKELKYQHRWFVGSRHSCSCGFRHLQTSAVELGFDLPQDWYEEEGEDIAATKEFFAVVHSLITGGFAVDCIDVWGHETEESTTIETIEVPIGNIPPGNFRFMEARHFVFSKSA